MGNADPDCGIGAGAVVVVAIETAFKLGATEDKAEGKRVDVKLLAGRGTTVLVANIRVVPEKGALETCVEVRLLDTRGATVLVDVI